MLLALFLAYVTPEWVETVQDVGVVVGALTAFAALVHHGRQVLHLHATAQGDQGIHQAEHTRTTPSSTSSSSSCKGRSPMFTKKFWKDAAERAGKTAGEAFLLAVGADRLNVLTADWYTLLGFSVGGVALSVAFSLASYKVGEKGTASVVKA